MGLPLRLGLESSRVDSARLGEAWRGEAWRGVARRGVARRGEAWRGEAWRGVGRRGVAWRGVARAQRRYGDPREALVVAMNRQAGTVLYRANYEEDGTGAYTLEWNSEPSDFQFPCEPGLVP